MKDAFAIIFEDDDLVVINKMAKLLVQPTSKLEKLTITSLLNIKLNHRCHPCHRLDRETTGLLLYAKSMAVKDKIVEQFRRSEVKKCYVAFVRGKMPRNGTIEGKIIDKDGQRYGEQKKFAKTLYHAVDVGEDFSVVDLTPLTGRTNQLRIQLAKMGYPILGEDKYAFRRDFPINTKRLALHAYYLRFSHPHTGNKMEFKLPLPEDMADFLRSNQRSIKL